MSLNAASVRREFQGVLIRVDVGDDGAGNRIFGYGCIHPWVELGDVALDDSLAMLADGEMTVLARRAVQCAQVDGAARRVGQSLFQGLRVPASHGTLLMEASAVAEAVERGFTTVKLKAGRDLDNEARFIKEQAALYPDMRWRLDFNHSQSAAVVEGFLASLGEDVVGRLDFIEDGYLVDELAAGAGSLKVGGVPMAVDRGVEEGSAEMDVAVIKPAVNESTGLLARARQLGHGVVYTSYMDHPVGQCFAAYEAALAYRDHADLMTTCGLVTHGLFEPDEALVGFLNKMGNPSPEFPVSTEAGLGFGDLLVNLEWEDWV